jgi:hypothetical protein
VALALTSLAGAAHAYCREVTQKTPPNYDPSQVGCFSGDGSTPVFPVFWRNQCVSYSLQMNASVHVPLAVAERIAKGAFDAWSKSPAAWCVGNGPPSIQAVEYPPVVCDQVLDVSSEVNNPIIFHDSDWPYASDTASALGYTTVSFAKTTGEIVGATIEINATQPIVYDVDGSVPDGSYDLESILLHEAGHFLGLAHSQEPTAVMYAFYHHPSTSLQLDDVAGICSIYPPDQTRMTATGSVPSTSCNPEPPLGFSPQCAPATADAGTAPSDGGDPAPCPTGLFTCAASRVPPAGGSRALGTTLALGLVLLRRGRARSRRRRSAARALLPDSGTVVSISGTGGEVHGPVCAESSSN